MINQEDNGRIRTVYLVLFLILLSNPGLQKSFHHTIRDESTESKSQCASENINPKGWLAIAELELLSLFISLLLMPKKAFDNVKIEQ